MYIFVGALSPAGDTGTGSGYVLAASGGLRAYAYAARLLPAWAIRRAFALFRPAGLNTGSFLMKCKTQSHARA